MEPGASEHMQKASLEVRHFLLPRSNLFRDNMRLSPPTYAFAKVSSKHLRNRIR